MFKCVHEQIMFLSCSRGLGLLPRARARLRPRDGFFRDGVLVRQVGLVRSFVNVDFVVNVNYSFVNYIHDSRINVTRRRRFLFRWAFVPSLTQSFSHRFFVSLLLRRLFSVVK